MFSTARLRASVVPCSSCKTPIDWSTADLSSEGEPRCPRCTDVADIGSSERRAVAAMKARAWGTLALGLFAWFYNPFWACSIIATVNAVTIARAMSDEWYVKRFPEGRGTTTTVALLGAALGWMPTLLLLFAVIVSVAR